MGILIPVNMGRVVAMAHTDETWKWNPTRGTQPPFPSYTRGPRQYDLPGPAEKWSTNGFLDLFAGQKNWHCCGIQTLNFWYVKWSLPVCDIFQSPDLEMFRCSTKTQLSWATEPLFLHNPGRAPPQAISSPFVLVQCPLTGHSFHEITHFFTRMSMKSPMFSHVHRTFHIDFTNGRGKFHPTSPHFSHGNVAVPWRRAVLHAPELLWHREVDPGAGQDGQELNAELLPNGGSHGKPWEDHGKTMGKPWENHKTIGKPWENHGKTMGRPWENHGNSRILKWRYLAYIRPMFLGLM